MAEDIEDCTSDIFIKLRKHPELYIPEKGTLKNYLGAAAKNKYLDASSVVRSTISENIKSSPNREEAWKQALILAKEFDRKLQILISEYDDRIEVLELQKQSSPEGI